MNSLFYKCSNLFYLPDISKWNIKNVTDLGCIFHDCSSLTTLPDISKWNTENVKDMNIGKIIYTINQKSPTIKIFGKGFVEINKNKAKIIKNYKLYNLKEEINNKKQNTNVEIKLKFLENMNYCLDALY